MSHYQVCHRYRRICFLNAKNVVCQSLDGWTFALYPYYIEGITGSLNTPQFQALADIVDVYCKNHCFYTNFENKKSDYLAYFDRYRNTKIMQIQAADDQFFLPDNEVIH